MSKPEFAAGSRAHILCGKAELDFDPTWRAAARAIEVYPHPATITLFGLDTIIPYKHKSGRQFADLQTSLRELLTRLGSLSTDEPPLLLADSEAWQETVATVRGATQKSHLRRVEDRIDAVLCAYVGLLHDRAPERSRVIGDAETRYIVVSIDDRVREKIDALGGGA